MSIMDESTAGVTSQPNPDVTPKKQKMDSQSGLGGVSEIVGATMAEMEYKVELLNKMMQSCFEKCIDKRYKEADLFIGENSCVDRCASKYWQVNNIVGQRLSGRSNSKE